MGRPPLRKIAMTGAERVRRYRQKHAAKSKSKDARQAELAEEDDCEAELFYDPDTRRKAFLLRADQARLFAKYTSGPIDNDVLRIAREAAAVWAELVRELNRKAKKPAVRAGRKRTRKGR